MDEKTQELNTKLQEKDSEEEKKLDAKFNKLKKKLQNLFKEETQVLSKKVQIMYIGYLHNMNVGFHQWIGALNNIKENIKQKLEAKTNELKEGLSVTGSQILEENKDRLNDWIKENADSLNEKLNDFTIGRMMVRLVLSWFR